MSGFSSDIGWPAEQRAAYFARMRSSSGPMGRDYRQSAEVAEVFAEQFRAYSGAEQASMVEEALGRMAFLGDKVVTRARSRVAEVGAVEAARTDPVLRSNLRAVMRPVGLFERR